MNVPSFEFLGFAAAVAVLVNISSTPNWRRIVLLVANLTFIATFTRDPLQLAPFAAFLAFGYAAIRLMGSVKAVAAFATLVTAAVCAFCWLKNYAFVPHALFLPFAYFTVGLSYVFFRVLHLIIDAFQDTLPDRVNPISYLNYALNFTSFVSGPIQFYADYRRTETVEPLPLDEQAMGRGLERIVTGLFKVSILSPLLGYAQEWCTHVLGAGLPFPERVSYAGLAVVLYPVYLYVNFSGYMDVVIGVARFLRLELPENFNHPFSAEGFIDFWGRWHITLSNWLKTYVYSPLLMSLMRRYPSRAVEPYLGVAVYFITFFLVGVWHGQTSMFLVFGVLNGLGVSVNKLYQIGMIRQLGRARYRELCRNPVYAACSRGLTFAWFAFALLWFWSSWGQLSGLAGGLGPAGTALALGFAIVAPTVVLAALGGIVAWLRATAFGGASALASPYARTAWCTLLFVITVSTAVVLDAPAPHLVYRAF